MKSGPSYAFKPLANLPTTKKFPLTAKPQQFTSTKLSHLTVASVEDFHSPISTLSLAIPAGSRFQSNNQIGSSNWLKFNAFKSTNTRSTIKITREADILGHALSSNLTRELLLLQVDFRRDDLPDVVSLLSDIVDGITRRDMEPSGIYTREFVRKTKDWNMSLADAVSASHQVSPVLKVVDDLHLAAFRRGLGNALNPVSLESSALTVDDALGFSIDCVKGATASSLGLLGVGVDHDDLLNATNYYFDSSASLGGTPSTPAASKYYGGEVFSSISCDPVLYAVGFQGASLASADYYSSLVLKHLIGSSNNLPSYQSVKYGDIHSKLSTALPSENNSVEVEAFSFSYSDAGLFGFLVSGGDATVVNAAVQTSIDVLKSVASGSGVSQDEVQRAVSKAKTEVAFTLESANRSTKTAAYADMLLLGGSGSVSVAEHLSKLDGVDSKAVSSLASSLLKSKASVATVGDPYNVLHADEIKL